MSYSRCSRHPLRPPAVSPFSGLAQLSVLIFIFLSAVPVFAKPVLLSHRSVRSAAPASSPLRCVRVSERDQSDGEIGDVVRRNQLAFFLASWYRVPIQLPVGAGAPGQAIHKLFDTCPGSAKQTKLVASTGDNDPCTLFKDRMFLFMCPPSDCQCHFSRMRLYLSPHLEAGCKELNVVTDGFDTRTYSGCLGTTLTRYLAGEDRKPAWEYDVLHYRDGELADREEDHVSPMRELYYLVRTMCLMSERDIVVMTDGAPQIPECGNRIVLAENTTTEEAFGLMKHARTVSVASSSLATTLMEIAKPERVVIRDIDAKHYEWVSCEKWSVIASDGGAFHFAKKEDMVHHLFSSRDLRDRSRRSDGHILKDVIKTSIPKRRWSKKMMH